MLLPLTEKVLNKTVLVCAIFIFGLTLFTNQYFHGGVYGTLHNLSVRPHVSISNAKIQNDTLSFIVFRDEGADVYGSFLIGIKLMDENGNTVFEQTQTQLSQLTSAHIKNEYVAKVKPGKHSLILPLGAKASLNFKETIFTTLEGKYTLELLDISGVKWQEKITVIKN